MTSDDNSDMMRELIRRREQIRRRLGDMDSTSNTGQRLQEDNKGKINDSNTGNILHIHRVMRCGVTVLFIAFVVSIVFIMGVLGWLIASYVQDVIACPEKLRELLQQIWTVLSGAFVVVFFQFITTLGKRISKNDDT